MDSQDISSAMLEEAKSSDERSRELLSSFANLVFSRGTSQTSLKIDLNPLRTGFVTNLLDTQLLSSSIEKRFLAGYPFIHKFA